jgi:hypothetical protein
MYTVALPGYAYDHPMPILALWRIACTAVGIAVELLVAICVFPVTARSAAHGAGAAALRGMADVAEKAFLSVLPSAAAQAGGTPRRGWLPMRPSRAGGGGEAASREASLPISREPSKTLDGVTAQGQEVATTPASPRSPAGAKAAQEPAGIALVGMDGKPGEPAKPAHVAIAVRAGAGSCWEDEEVAQGAVLRRIYEPLMQANDGRGPALQ